MLVKKPDALDPLEFPWLFLAEGRGRDGADRLRFQARNHRPRPGGGPESDLVEIAYWLVSAEEGEGFELLRWSSARPPVAPLDRNFPRRDDPGVELLASHVALFGVRLQDEDGAWQSAWDSCVTGAVEPAADRRRGGARAPAREPERGRRARGRAAGGVRAPGGLRARPARSREGASASRSEEEDGEEETTSLA